MHPETVLFQLFPAYDLNRNVFISTYPENLHNVAPTYRSRVFVFTYLENLYDDALTYHSHVCMFLCYRYG